MYLSKEELHSFLESQEMNFGTAEAHSVWEMLYWCYVQLNPVDSETVRGQLASLDDCLRGLTLEENDQVCYLVSDLCLQCEKEAFFAGLQTGLRLGEELAEQ